LAHEGARVGFSVEKQQHACATPNGIAYCLLKPGAQKGAPIHPSKIHDFDLRQGFRPMGRFEDRRRWLEATRLQGEMRRTQHEKRLLIVRSHPGDVPSVISRFLGFLQRGILFPIDPDQAERMQWNEHGGPCANHHGDIVPTNPVPDCGSLFV
jgi:hypothetical protein